MDTMVSPRVVIDEAIQRQPELAEGVAGALAFLGRHFGPVSPPAAIRWRFAMLDPTSVELAMSDAADFDGFVARQVFPVRYLKDDVNRDIMALRVWRGLLAERSRNNMVRINQLFAQLEEEASDGGEDTHRPDR